MIRATFHWVSKLQLLKKLAMSYHSVDFFEFGANFLLTRWNSCDIFALLNNQEVDDYNQHTGSY